MDPFISPILVNIIILDKIKKVNIGSNPEENKKPTDVEGVREKIHFGIWKSAIVVDISVLFIAKVSHFRKFICIFAN